MPDFGISRITSAHIEDLTIVDADISNSAAISPTKLKDVDKDVLVQKTGRWECASKWELDVSGIFKDMQYVGNWLTTTGLDASGGSQVISTGTGGANSWAGVYIFDIVGSFQGWTRPTMLPRVKLRQTLPLRSAGDLCFVSGFWTGIAFPPVTDGNPMDVNNGGVLVGFDSDDANINLYVGSGDGATAPSAPVSTGQAVPTSLQSRIIDIEFLTSTSAIVKIFDGNSGAELWSSGTITTNLPATTKSLNWLNLLRSPTNVSKNIAAYGAWGKMLK